jgi:hypothetical protein
MVRKPEGKRRGYEDNIKVDVKWCGRAWTGITWLRMRTGAGLL